MAKVGFNYAAGETVAQRNSTIGGDTIIYPKEMSNLYYDDGALHVRCSTKLVATITTNGTLNSCFIDEIRKWLLVSDITNNVLRVTIVKDLDVSPTAEAKAFSLGVNTLSTNTVSVGAANALRSQFVAVRKSKLETTRNAVEGNSAILVSGCDKLYYLDDSHATATSAKVFQIWASNTNKPFLKPISCLTEQQRLMIIGLGADLAGNNDSTLTDENAFYGSVNNSTLDNFSIAISSTVRESEVAFKFEFSLSPTESLYGMREFMQKIIITSSESIYALTSNSMQISSVDGSLNRVGSDGVGCKNSDPVQFDGLLLYASLQGMRQQYLAAAAYADQMYQIYDVSCNMNSPLPIERIESNPAHSNVLGFMSDGTIKALYWAPQETPKAPANLAMTTYFKSQRFACYQAPRTASSIYDLLVLKDKNKANTYYVASETNEYSGRELIRPWNPKATVTAWANNRITISGFTDTDNISGVFGIWLKAKDQIWCYCVRDNDTDLDFTYINDIDLGSGTFTGTFYVLFDTTNIFNQLPVDFKQTQLPNDVEPLRLDLSYNCVGSDMQIHINSSVSQLKGAPLDMPTDKLSFTTSSSSEFIKMELSYWQPNPKIEWWGSFTYPSSKASAQSMIIQVNNAFNNAYLIKQNNTTIEPVFSSTNANNGFASHRFTISSDQYNKLESIEFVNKATVYEDKNDFDSIPKVIRMFPVA